MEGDERRNDAKSFRRYFNPLPPHGGRLISAEFTRIKKTIFQSTPSAWRETIARRVPRTVAEYFNPLPPHGGRHKENSVLYEYDVFQSTPSAWRETTAIDFPGEGVNISIHSLRMEGDVRFFIFRRVLLYFNPLPPHGGRLARFSGRFSIIPFQSTPSAWRETRRLSPRSP